MDPACHGQRGKQADPTEARVCWVIVREFALKFIIFGSGIVVIAALLHLI